nr:hypothetical protein [Tanacetum cinerariifolium]
DLSTSATGRYVNGQYTDTGIAQSWQRKAPKYGTAADDAMSSTITKFSTTLGNLYNALGDGAPVVAYNTLQQRKTSGKYSSTFGAQLDDGSVITGLMASDSILNMIGAMADLDTTTATAKEKVDALNTAVGTYYQAFFSADEQFADLTD